jgi:adenylate kinase family enzyme
MATSTFERVQRVVVVGGPGTGKSTLARVVSATLGAEHVELDALWWDAGWVPSDPGQFVMKTRDCLLDTKRWIVDGNYLDVVGRAEVWPAADTVVWLDLPRRVAFRRTIQRSARRVFTRQSLWSGNREQLSIFAPSSLARLWNRWPRYGEQIQALLKEPDLDHLEVVRLRSPRDVRRFRRTLRGRTR